MTAKFFDLRLIALAFALVVVLMGVTMMDDNGTLVWHRPGTDFDAPVNDCGHNHTLKFIYYIAGQRCEVTKGTASKDYVDRLAQTFKSEGDVIASPIERALHYIENVVWKYGGYSPK